MTIDPHANLPTGADVGTHARTWELPTSPVDGDSATYRIDARFIGMGTSRQHQHRHHDDGVAFARTNQRCGACRWFETRIFRTLQAAGDSPTDSTRVSYVLHHTGVSIVPGEVNFYRYERAYSAHEVIEAFTVRQVRNGQPTEPFMTRPAARALAQAAGYDRELENAYLDRAVS